MKLLVDLTKGVAFYFFWMIVAMLVLGLVSTAVHELISYNRFMNG